MVLQDVDGILRGHTGDGGQENVGRFPGPQQLHTRDCLQQSGAPVPEGRLPGQILPERGQGGGTGGPEAHQGGRGLGAAAIASS